MVFWWGIFTYTVKIPHQNNEGGQGARREIVQRPLGLRV